MVVVCSSGSLCRDRVAMEIEEALASHYTIIPLSVDHDWRAPSFRIARGDRDLKQELISRAHIDFVEQGFQSGLERLLSSLARRERHPKKHGGRR
jgi:hypothetical protein